MDTFKQDLRFAVRSLLKSPGFTGIAVSCMALGIAVNVFVYSPVNALLIKPLPYRDSGRIMHLNTWPTDREQETYFSWSWSDLQDVQRASRDVFSEWGAYTNTSWNLAGNMEAERVEGARVTASLFPMMGLQPSLGRFFRDEEEVGGRVAVIGHGLWQRKFGSDPAVLGRAVTVNGMPYTVIGVMQEKVRFPEIEELWIPADPSVDERERRDARTWQFLARLAPGVSQESAEARVQALMRDLATRYPSTNRAVSAWILPFNDNIKFQVGGVFMTMVGAVGFVLLIACSNVANLLLARGSSRQRELAVRLSLGATRGRLVRQMLTESLLLALLGGLSGVLLGTWGTLAFTQWGMPSEVPWWLTFDIDRTVLLMTLGITVVSGLVFGITPALKLSRPDLSRTLKEGGGSRGGSAHGSLGRTRATLVISQLALSLVLLVGAALMVQSFLRTQNARLGFDRRGLLTGRLVFAGERYASDSARLNAQSALLRELRSTPGVAGAALAGWLPIAGCCSDDVYRIPGRTYEPGREPSAIFNVASEEYFGTLNARLLRGREFTEADRAGSARVAVVSETLARREWGSADPIGQTLTIGSDSIPVSVVGVVSDMVVLQLNDRERTRAAQLYVPLAQAGWARVAVVVRAHGDPSGLVSAVRNAMTATDKDLPLSRIFTMDQVIRDRWFQDRVFSAMFTVFGLAALLLASIGLYGVMSYTVSQRRQEMGVRMALGARPRHVLRLVLGSGARLLAVGVLIGVPAAFGLAQLLRGSLYGITATDPLTFAVIPIVLAVVALTATFVPARRATRVELTVAMRAE